MHPRITADLATQIAADRRRAAAERRRPTRRTARPPSRPRRHAVALARRALRAG